MSKAMTKPSYPFTLLCVAATFVASQAFAFAPSRANPTAFASVRASTTHLSGEESPTGESSKDQHAEKNHTEGVEDPFLPSEANSDILSSPAFLKRKLEVLQQDIKDVDEKIAAAAADLEAGKAEWGPKLDDLEKESLNIQERISARAESGTVRETVQVARVLVNVIDEFDRAFNAITPEGDDEDKIDADYRKTYGKIFSTFKEMGITEVESVGQEFNYEVHNAVMMRPSDEYEEGIVCEELQKGYIYGEDLIREAAVVVAA